MPKFVTPMPLVIFRQLKSPGFYPLGGVQGLYLRIRGASESYILRYQDTFGNRRSMSLGLRRSMSLSEARVKATEIRARLSECQAIEVLKKVRPNRPRTDELIFKTENGGSFSEAATTALIRRMHARQKALDGIGWIDPDKSKREDKVCVITAHGTARSGFRTWAKDDRLGHNRKFDQEAAELCLLHCKASDNYHGAYDRARLSSERQRLMDDWGEFCCSLVSDDTSST